MQDVSVAVTTAPRRDCTLAYCLASIEACGWEPIVFAEPGSTQTDHQTVWNERRLGVWHNWLSSAKWMLLNTSFDYIMTVQDDSLFHPDSGDFVERLEWPDNAAFVSLYTPKHYSIIKGNVKTIGVNRIRTRSLWGACALLWTRRTLSMVVSHPKTATWLGAKPRSNDPAVYEKRRQNPHLIANSDTAIGMIINKIKLGMYFVDPSPVQHIAEHSTIAHGGNGGRRNCWRCADFERPLWEQVYGTL